MNDLDLYSILGGMDHTNDDIWTTTGLPSLEYVKVMAGTEVTRAELTRLFPDFKRGEAITSHEQDNVPAMTDDELYVSLTEELKEYKNSLGKLRSAIYELEQKRDVVIMRRTVAADSVVLADNVNKFQKSQSDQRRREAQAQIQLRKAVMAAKV